MTVRRAIVPVSKQWITDLCFPLGSKIISVLSSEDRYLADNIEFVIEHDELKEVGEGEQYPIKEVKVVKDKVDVPVMNEFHFEWHEP